MTAVLGIYTGRENVSYLEDGPEHQMVPILLSYQEPGRLSKAIHQCTPNVSLPHRFLTALLLAVATFINLRVTISYLL